MKWVIELSEFDISYQPRAAIKAQAMANFVAEFIKPEVDPNHTDAAASNNRGQVWQLSVDGSSGEQVAGAGVILDSPDGKEVSYAFRLEFKATNNQVEYKALIVGLELAQAVRANKGKVRTDSQLVANHISERFQPRNDKMEQYLLKVRQMIRKFKSVAIVQIPRSENRQVDILARMAAIADPKIPKSAPMEVKSFPSIEQSMAMMQIEQK